MFDFLNAGFAIWLDRQPDAEADALPISKTLDVVRNQQVFLALLAQCHFWICERVHDLALSCGMWIEGFSFYESGSGRLLSPPCWRDRSRWSVRQRPLLHRAVLIADRRGFFHGA